MLPDLNDQAYETASGELEIYGSAERLDPLRDLVDYFRDYAREKPGTMALWCLGIGFVLGWKLKPW